MNRTYTGIYGKAAAIYNDPEQTESGAYNDMQTYLMDKVKASEISMSDKCRITRSIMENADPQMAYDLERAGL